MAVAHQCFDQIPVSLLYLTKVILGKKFWQLVMVTWNTFLYATLPTQSYKTVYILCGNGV